MRYIAVAALALVGTAMMSCSENDFAENQPNGKAVTLTTTISLDGSSSTRALDADGKKTFAKGEQIALIYESETDGAQKVVSAALQETDILSDGKKATLTFSLEKAPKKEGTFAMIYPASMAQDPDGGEFSSTTLIAHTALSVQDGTLESLSTKFDLATCDSKFTDNATLPGDIKLTNELVIAEFTIKNFAGTDDITNKITNLVINYGPYTYTVNRTAAAGPIYVAMWYCGENYKVSITANEGLYQKEVKGVTLDAGSMYPVNLKMQKLVDLSKQTNDYEAQDGDILTGTLVANVKISIAAGAAVTLKAANIMGSGTWAGITCLGDATIILERENEVKAFANNYPGIQAAHNASGEEYTLTIKGRGSLETTGGYHAAGIGSGPYETCGTCGNIKIEGGTITATGGDYGAGIGSGRGEDGNFTSCGNITISGDATKITATGGKEAAGIGGGHKGKFGNITIENGYYIKAKGGDGGAGIGNGYSGNNNTSTITISGGNITATGGENAAGIGSSYYGVCKAITISGGKIEAQGGQKGAGIGGGIADSCGDITISGDATIITATGGKSGAGIGGGISTNEYYSSCGDITISGGTITAQGGTNINTESGGGAGIGSGYGYDAEKRSVCGTITISGGKISAKGGESGSGIGCGAGIGSGRYGKCDNITISGGTIELAQGGKLGAGIGSAVLGICGNINISDGTITAKGGENGAGIGCGQGNSLTNSVCGDITISGGTITATGDRHGTGIGNSQYGKCGAITITNGVTNVTAMRGSSTNSNCIGNSGGIYPVCGKIIFGTATVYSGDDTSTTTPTPTHGAWTTSPMEAGDYGGLTLVISTTTNANDTWTLTPASN